MYQILKTEGRAKRAKLTTVHGTIQTPVFMNVGTAAAIKGAVSTVDLHEIGTQVELSNTYHLHVRPGDQVIKKLGALHKFMNIYSHIDIHTACVCSYPLWWPDNSCSCIQYIQLFLCHWMICMQNSPFFADLQQREFLFSTIYSIIPVIEC